MSVNNRLLFSEIFFKQIRRETADLANLRATLATIRDTWRYFCQPPEDWAGLRWQPDAPIDPNDGTALRDNVIQPIFGALELTYGPCDTGAALSPHLSPFFLYGDWAMQERAGLCLVLPYAADIEGRDTNGRIPKGHNYAQQLLRLLREHDLEWGVLTNGRHWRLIHRTELSPTDTYLDLNLEPIIAANDIESYVIFHRFFSRSALERHDGRQRLSHYKQQSDQASKVIEDHLSAYVEEITRQLCQGLVESCRAAGEDVTVQWTRKEIYKNALYLVYRLLFVLYAEARELLPLDLPAYRAVCLRELLTEVGENHRNGLHYADDHALWERLQKLFALIDQGDQLAGVPAYNGGLFDPGRRPFLTDHRIANAYLQAALIRLSTMPAKGSTYDQDRTPAPIDYRDLSVRHLGSLYEGLLEYNLFEVKDEPRVVRSGKKQTEYVPYSQAGKVRAGETVLRVGDVYFSETEGERKATGSYYTPEDVVDYIVRNTVLVKLAELRTEFYGARGIERQLHDLADIPADLPAHRQIQLELDRQFVGFVNEQVLNLKILDMAMGSGHFLVNATHAVANFIVEFLNETPWENAAIDSDVATWRRRVAERCIFGVDLNELAVELAKLCLWMTTTARGKPLTFLDHHLRWGNSLVGAWMKDVGVYPLAKKRGEPAFTLPLGTFQVALDQALAGYRELYALDSDDVEEVRQKARVYEQEIRPVLERYRELFDLHTAVYFGQKLDETVYARLGASVQGPETWIETKADFELEEPLKGWGDQHWFHWELEFSEAFSVPSPGFCATVGNPPYVDIVVTPFIRRNYDCASARNLYAYMLELSRRVSTKGARVGMIVPLSLVCSDRMAELRNQLALSCSEIRVANFGIRPAKLFPDVDQRVTLIVAELKDSSDQNAVIQSTRFNHWYHHQRPELLSSLRFVDITDVPGGQGWAKLGDKLGHQIALKLLTHHNRISDHLGPGWKFYYHGIGRYWLKAYDFAPTFSDGADNPSQSSTLFELSAPSQLLGKTIVGILNSSLFFWYWVLYGDDFHVTNREIVSFPFIVNPEFADRYEDIGRIVDELMEDYKRNSVVRTVRSSKGTVIKLQEFCPRRSKNIIDRIDDLLGPLYGLTNQQVEYIKTYDLAFRTDED